MQKSILAVAAALLISTIVALAEPVHQAELIFPPQEKHVHGSSIVQTPGGDFIACWFYGSGERSANDVRIRGARLEKGAQAWSEVFEVADTPNIPDCNPVLFIDENQILRLFWIAVRANKWEHSLLLTRTSTNYEGDGAPEWDWQDAIILVPGDEFTDAITEKFKELNPPEPLWAEYALPYTELILEASKDKNKRQEGWMTRIHPLQLPGRMLVPLYSDGFNVSLCAISDDQGATWRASKPIVGLGPIQPTLIPKKDGTIMAYCRDSGGANRVLVSSSADKGESWSAAVPSDIPNPGSSLEVIVLKDGTWAMIYNDTENGRHRIRVALSDDEGGSWKWGRYPDESEPGKGSYAYPSMIQTPDGMLHASYTWNGEGGKSIKHAAFNTEWVKAQ